jgi:hypothetical protein
MNSGILTCVMMLQSQIDHTNTNSTLHAKLLRCHIIHINSNSIINYVNNKLIRELSYQTLPHIRHRPRLIFLLHVGEGVLIRTNQREVEAAHGNARANKELLGAEAGEEKVRC